MGGLAESSARGTRMGYRGRKPITAPRTNLGVPDSGTGVLPWVFDGKTPFEPWMKDSRLRVPGIRDHLDSRPRHAILLTAAPQVNDVVLERTECSRVRRY